MGRPHPALLALARGKPFTPPDDADAFLNSTVEHRMTGLVWSRIENGSLQLPGKMVKSLAAEDLANNAHHQRLWCVLEEVTSRLSERGIQTVTFKGVTDEARWFDRTGERPCSDIDILVVDMDRFDEAIATLAPSHPVVGNAAALARTGLLRALDIWVDGVLVDIHVDPVKVGPGWIHPEEWISRTMSLYTPSGQELTVFDDVATTALRLLHLGRDRFRYLLWIVEAERILDAEAPWEDVLVLARLERLASPVGVAAQIVLEELHRPVIKRTPENWRSVFWRYMWGPKIRMLGELGRKRYVRRSGWLLPLTMPGRTIESLMWIGRSIVPPPVLHDLKHPGGRGPYPLRLVAGRTTYLLRRRLEARADRRR